MNWEYHKAAAKLTLFVAGAMLGMLLAFGGLVGFIEFLWKPFVAWAPWQLWAVFWPFLAVLGVYGIGYGLAAEQDEPGPMEPAERITEEHVETH